MIQREEANGLVTLTLAHGKASALDLELCDAITKEFRNLGAARGVLLTGSGSIFSAGVDLFRLINEGTPYVELFLPALDAAIRTLFEVEIPVVAALNGHAIAGGCVLAAACDHRVMAQGKGRIGVPELLVGVPFPPSALEVMRHAVPHRYLSMLTTSGATVTPDDALQYGLVDEVVAAEELVARAKSKLEQLTSIPTPTFSLNKRLLRRPATEAMEREEKAFGNAVLAIWREPATHEHIRAYLEKTVGKR